MVYIDIVLERCNGCKICEKQCPVDVFKVEDKKCYAVGVQNCMACRLCETICKEFAITVTEH